MEKPSDVKAGDYVLGTKFTDGDPGDPWAVGIYVDSYDHFGTIRHRVIHANGELIYGRRGFERVGRISDEYGEWLLSISKHLEASPPGTVNLWGMMGVRATPDAEQTVATGGTGTEHEDANCLQTDNPQAR